MEHWTEEFEHPSITPENEEAFATAMVKYGTENDAIVGGFEAMKLAGKPFKLPESLDKLPDDNARGEFTTQVSKILGIETAENIEALTDLDMAVGMAEDGQVDENLANAFKQFVVSEKIPKAVAQKAVAFHNQMMAKAKDAFTQQAAKTNEALIAHFGSAEKVAEQSELLRRVIQNTPGITPDEYEKVGEVMADSMLTKDPVMARVMLTLLAPLAAEDSTEGGRGGAPLEKPKTVKDVLPETSKVLGW